MACRGERHVRDFRALPIAERLCGEVHVAADPRRADAQVAGTLFGIGDEFFQVIERRAGLHRKHRQLDRHAGDGLERRVVERHHSRVIRGRDRVGIERQRVAIRFFRLDMLVADGAAPAANGTMSSIGPAGYGWACAANVANASAATMRADANTLCQRATTESIFFS